LPGRPRHQPAQGATNGAAVAAATRKLLACGEKAVGGVGAVGAVNGVPPSLVIAAV
jgi:hypothetical protein